MNYLVHCLNERVALETAKTLADTLDFFHLDLNDLLNKLDLTLMQNNTLDVLEHYNDAKRIMLEQFGNFKNTIFTISGYGFLDESSMKKIKEKAQVIFVSSTYKSYLEFYSGHPNKKLQKLSFEANSEFFKSFADVVVRVKTSDANKIVKLISKNKLIAN
ncbi:MAG: hypothetical protein FWD89_02595 [Firmicutes bacterium]|nr:hypothetical protein [Bacillota bacterium]